MICRHPFLHSKTTLINDWTLVANSTCLTDECKYALDIESTNLLLEKQIARKRYFIFYTSFFILTFNPRYHHKT